MHTSFKIGNSTAKEAVEQLRTELAAVLSRWEANENQAQAGASTVKMDQYYRGRATAYQSVVKFLRELQIVD